MRTGVAEQVGGCHCIVIHTDGTSEVRKFSKDDHTEVFDKAKGIIGCRWLDNIIVQQFAPDVRMVYLVNDNGYAEWGNNPKKVNQIATYVYNGGNKPGHYVLGDVVMCWLIDTDDGGEFIGMSELAANRLCRETAEKIAPKAKEVVPIPDSIPDPLVKVMSFESTDDLIRHMDGDTSVKPDETVVVSGNDAEAKA